MGDGVKRDDGRNRDVDLAFELTQDLGSPRLPERLDLRVRGPGDFLGTRQSGTPGFQAARDLPSASICACCTLKMTASAIEQKNEIASEPRTVRTRISIGAAPGHSSARRA